MNEKSTQNMTGADVMHELFLLKRKSVIRETRRKLLTVFLMTLLTISLYNQRCQIAHTVKDIKEDITDSFTMPEMDDIADSILISCLQ